MGKLPSALVRALVGMGAEKIALALEQVLWEARGPGTVVISEGRTEGGNRDSVCGCRRHDQAPVFLGFLNRFGEVAVEKEVG